MRADGSGKQRVTSLGTVEGAPAWSPDGTTLAFAAAGYLHTIRSTSPFGSPVKPVGVFTGCWDCGPDDPVTDIYVDRYVAWSPDGTRIALYNHFDPRYDDAIYMYYPATGEAAQLTATGGDCSRSWRDLFWSAGGQFGYTAESLGGDCTVHPPRIIYPGFAWVDGDAGGAPSPDGRFMALTNASSGSARVYVANIDGTGRRLLTTGYQPDWQPRP